MVLNYDFRKGANKSGHLDLPSQSYGQIYFNIFRYISAKIGWLWMTTRYIKNKNCFVKDLHQTAPGLHWEWLGTPEPREKMFPLENVTFRGLRLSLCHFGQQVPESPVSQLQNGVSTSSLPPFSVDLLLYKVYPRSNSFFQCRF